MNKPVFQLVALVDNIEVFDHEYPTVTALLNDLFEADRKARVAMRRNTKLEEELTHGR